MTYKIRDPLSLRHNVLDFDSKTVTSENIQENTTERQGQAKAERGWEIFETVSENMHRGPMLWNGYGQ